MPVKCRFTESDRDDTVAVCGVAAAVSSMFLEVDALAGTRASTRTQVYTRRRRWQSNIFMQTHKLQAPSTKSCIKRDTTKYKQTTQALRIRDSKSSCSIDVFNLNYRRLQCEDGEGPSEPWPHEPWGGLGSECLAQQRILRHAHDQIHAPIANHASWCGVWHAGGQTC